MTQVTIGGERLGSGNKSKAYLKNYERSTHDLSYTWRSTMAAGTLVPFLCEVALPGDTFDINLNADMLTHPTIGPLFGSYKIQLDVFQVPIRLYQGKLHMNLLGIGMDMSAIKLPQVRIIGKPYNMNYSLDNQHINPSSIFSYLGIRGLGQSSVNPTSTQVQRDFNAVPWLAYWDIYKQYYSNKMEEVGYVIHRPAEQPTITIADALFYTNPYAVPINIPVNPTPPLVYQDAMVESRSNLTITTSAGLSDETDLSTIFLNVKRNSLAPEETIAITDLFHDININVDTDEIFCTNPNFDFFMGSQNAEFGGITQILTPDQQPDTEPLLQEFPLENIDNMRVAILADTASTSPFIINQAAAAPYGLPLDYTTVTPVADRRFSVLYNQEGLGVKTYQSDLFNNWINTEFIDGADGISAITAVDTSGGSFTIDELNLSKKVYDMLNRIAVSGGTYDDWLTAVYDHDRIKSAENPIYLGGLIKNLVFQEVISNSASEDQPLGTLAGRGRVGGKHKGGNIIAKIDEPSYIMGIISLTPYVDYSQGNKWDVNLKTMNDFHKPALDEIGFQDLITEQMAHWDSTVNSNDPNFRSAGKQPAWSNYMTNIDVVKGNFADETQQMFMVLNRRYTPEMTSAGFTTIKDLTTYIDPKSCNYIFADTRRDAQNFWAQIGVSMIARRKMSAKVMPNL